MSFSATVQLYKIDDEKCSEMLHRCRKQKEKHRFKDEGTYVGLRMREHVYDTEIYVK